MGRFRGTWEPGFISLPTTGIHIITGKYKVSSKAGVTLSAAMKLALPRLRVGDSLPGTAPVRAETVGRGPGRVLTTWLDGSQPSASHSSPRSGTLWPPVVS